VKHSMFWSLLQCKGWFTQKVRPWNGWTLALQIHTSQFHAHFNTRLSRRMRMSYFDWQIVLTCFPWYQDSIGLVVLFFECHNWNLGLRICYTSALSDNFCIGDPPLSILCEFIDRGCQWWYNVCRWSLFWNVLL
jgi:hypothetical protein